ncbi:hypothetical protein GCM10010885_24570 [Alicyclobacillus cellulosilyticus]|uniref:Glycosyl-hydrolase family 116 N-terminal domain-containing protein n=1 Tax=Alicyclobacillus cellulosilyticus TaxID=1003997 RepID=A0A917NNM3_9BACL|nr:hypothetical protein GCM10010885_24570 [Alicyclobacillus cellulosilyticus]
MPNTYFTIWAKSDGEPPVAKILESRLTPPYDASHGLHPSDAGGLPRLARSFMRGEYPFVWIDFEDDDLPVSVQLEAFTPFIPLNPEDSGIPGAIFTYRVTNSSSRAVEVTIAGSLFNPIGGVGRDRFGNVSGPRLGGSLNLYRAEQGITGLELTTRKYAPTQLEYGNMALITTNRDVSYKRAWYRGAWFDELQEFWTDLVDDGRLTDLGYETPSEDGRSDTCSLAVHERIGPGETRLFRFVLSWYFPNRLNGWSEEHRVGEPGKELTQNYYVNLFSDAWSAARYLVSNFERLYQASMAFHDALYSTVKVSSSGVKSVVHI